MNWLARFMYGRRGPDQLSLFIIAVSVILSVVNWFVPPSVVRTGIHVANFLLMALCIYRVISKNIPRRQRENEVFLRVWYPIASRLRRRPYNPYHSAPKAKRRDKTHLYFSCPSCGQRVRVPKGKGAVVITCPSCKGKFTEKT